VRARRNSETLIARARTEGGLRRDAAAADFLWILIANGAYLQATRDVAPNAGRRYVALILDALRAPGASELPAPPTKRQVNRAVQEIGRLGLSPERLITQLEITTSMVSSPSGIETTLLLADA